MLILTGLAQTDVPIQTTQVSDTIWFATLGFGAFALLLVGVVQVYRTRKQQDDRLVSFVPFARTYGLIVIATLAAALTLSNIDVDAKTGAYALLGTIPGYLAATATGSGSSSPPGGNGGNSGEAGNEPGGDKKQPPVDHPDSPGREAVI